MIILLTGASHTGKTLFAQKLLQRYLIPYLSIDHLKMGLIRSHQTTLGVEDDDALTPYLWSILQEIIKTAIENKQDLIIEGCYIPENWKDSFTSLQLQEIHFHCLIMSKHYIEHHFDEILHHANCIEQRIDDSYCTKEHLLQENDTYLKRCKRSNDPYTLIDDTYEIDCENL